VAQKQEVQQVSKPVEFSEAKNELNGVANNLGSSQNVFVKPPSMKRKESEDVLPKLSVADQISELERIIEGLNEHVFNSEQLEIIKEEVLGLKRAVQKGEQEKETGDPERFLALCILRDSRLDMVLDLLSKSGK
jgi:hypothetical protein